MQKIKREKILNGKGCRTRTDGRTNEQTNERTHESEFIGSLSDKSGEPIRMEIKRENNKQSCMLSDEHLNAKILN